MTAPERITELNAGTPFPGVPAWNDLVEMVDVTNAADHASGTSFPVEIGKLARTPCFIVAASDAPIEVRNSAHAVCDGADDEVEINAALAQGAVLLTDGTYSVGSTINMNLPGASLRGVGVGRPLWSGITEGLSGTIIRPDAGFAASTPVIAMEDQDQTISGGQFLGGLTIYGVDAVNAGVSGVRFRAFQSIIENLLIHDMTGSGIIVTGDDATSWNPYDSTIRNCMLSTCNIGLELTSDVGSATDLHIADCTIMHNATYGLDYSGGSSTQFVNCHWYNADATNAIRLAGGGTRSKFVACKIEGSQEHLVHIDNSGTGVSELQFSACSFMLGGQKTDNTYSLIKITGFAQCTHMMVVGCIFGEYGSPPPPNGPKYAIEVGNYAPYATIVGNNFNRGPFGTARLQLSATSKDNSIVRANLGVADHTGSLVSEQTL